MKSLTPKVLLPEGTECKTWEATPKFAKTYHVDQAHPKASDNGPGTRERPCKTISRAAEVRRPGERVVVASGVDRERVTPARGGESPTKMIAYEAAPGAAVVIKGSDVFTEKWTRSSRNGKTSKRLWQAPLAAKYFGDYNPFDTDNVTAEQFVIMRGWAWALRGRVPYTLPRGMIFQEGKFLKQAARYETLEKNRGTFWVDRSAQVVHIHPLDGGDPSASLRAGPNGKLFEITTRRIAFGPDQMGLGFIRVKGFVVEQVGNAFPMQQEGAISTWRGHHWIIEDNTVRWANGVGIDLGRQTTRWPQPPVIGHHICRRNIIEDIGVCGIAGIGSFEDFGVLIEDNVLRRCAYHNVARLYETGGIKTHGNTNCLIRRNLIVDTLHGPAIWMDFANANSRCCQNVILNTRSSNGAIFIEASFRPNLIDHNIIWGTRGTGIYEHDCSNQVFAHNLIGRSSKNAIRLRGKITNRKIQGRPIVGGSHRVLNNVFVANRANRVIEYKASPKSTIVGNLVQDVTAELDPKTLILIWSVAGKLPTCEPLDAITHDFFGRPRPPGAPAPGPFATLPTEPRQARLWPVRAVKRR